MKKEGYETINQILKMQLENIKNHVSFFNLKLKKKIRHARKEICRQKIVQWGA